MRRMRKTLPVLGIVAALALVAPAASAVECSNLPDEPAGAPIAKIYIESGDTQEPLVKKLGKLLVGSSAGKLRILYRNRPTCAIAKDLFNGATMQTATDGTTPRPVKYIPVDPAQDAQVCTVPDAPALGEPIKLGIGATYITSCSGLPSQPATIGVLDGPVQSYGFITHKQSSQVAITAEEGYLAFGFPEGTGEAAPWTVQNLRFKRSDTASTTLTMSSAVRIRPATKFLATLPQPSDTSLNLIGSVGAQTSFDAVIGVLGTELFDQHRDDASNIKLLAFKGFDQRFAYYPDRDNTTFDKQNVRDGHYLPWSPTPYLGAISGGALVDPDARRIYELVLGARPASEDVDGLAQVVASGLVPRCAMKVTRTGDGADLSVYDDPAPCGCSFEKNVKNGATTCSTCVGTGTSTCGAGTCRLGFCEAK